MAILSAVRNFNSLVFMVNLPLKTHEKVIIKPPPEVMPLDLSKRCWMDDALALPSEKNKAFIRANLMLIQSPLSLKTFVWTLFPASVVSFWGKDTHTHKQAATTVSHTHCNKNNSSKKVSFIIPRSSPHEPWKHNATVVCHPWRPMIRYTTGIDLQRKWVCSVCCFLVPKKNPISKMMRQRFKQ